MMKISIDGASCAARLDKRYDNGCIILSYYGDMHIIRSKMVCRYFKTGELK